MKLVKSVVQSMMVHYISIYNWPASSIKVIETCMRNFSWIGNLENKKVVIVSWKTCCRSLKEGCFGLKSLKTYNEASNLHLCWNFYQDKNGWSQLLASRVRRNNIIFTHNIKYSLWSNITTGFGKVKDCTHWLIVNGYLTNFFA